jgi:fluoroquinolone resistance protein
MNKIYIEDKVFEQINFSVKALEKGNYDNCTFINCDFYNANLTNINFAECSFKTCNLSLCKVENTAFKTVKFTACKMLGVNFTDCNPFLLALAFEDCSLNVATFYQLKLKGTIFNNCSLQEVDFTETDLSQATFNNCDLSRAVFEQTNLEKADLRSAYGYIIDPSLNRIKKAKFSIAGVMGLLVKYDIEVS